MKDYFKDEISDAEAKKIVQRLNDAITEDVRNDIDEIKVALRGIIGDIERLECNVERLNQKGNL